MKIPSFQFYPGDWRKDPGVQALDYFDRGVWLEILCLMHESEERGVLLLNGRPMPNEALARLLGLVNQNPTTQVNQNPTRDLTTVLTTLLAYGVAHRREEDGALYNKRMMRDDKIRKVRTESGSKGGNPRLLNQKSTKAVNQNPTTQDNQNPTPSSSSSSSDLIPPLPPKGGTGDVPEKTSDPPKKARRPDAVDPAVLALPIPPKLDTPEFRAAWKAWLEYRLRRKKSTPVDVYGATVTLKRLAKQGPSLAVEMIEEAIAAGWQGIVFDKNRSPGNASKPGPQLFAPGAAESPQGQEESEIANKRSMMKYFIRSARYTQEQAEKMWGGPIDGPPRAGFSC